MSTSTMAEIQQARASISAACTAMARASISAPMAGVSNEIVALHLHMILIDRQLSLVADRIAGLASRRRA